IITPRVGSSQFDVVDTLKNNEVVDTFSTRREALEFMQETEKDSKAQSDSSDAAEEAPKTSSGPVAAITVHSDLDDAPRLVRIRAGEYLKPAMRPCPPEHRGTVE